MATADATRQHDPATFRLLVVAAEEVGGPKVRSAIADLVRDREAEILLIAPALTDSALEQAMGSVDEAIAAARERLERSTAELERAGLEVEGAVGDSDLRLAIEDALRRFAADEILIVAHRDGGPGLEQRWIEEAERDFEPPITEIYVEREHGGEPSIAEVEHVEGGSPRARDEATPRNLPPFAPLDVVGIAVAIVGTIVLVVLAATGNDDLNTNGGFGDDGGLSAQSAKILIAGGMALVNLAHVVGLTLFQSGPYRGFWRDFFARLSLFGTPAAIIVCLLLG